MGAIRHVKHVDAGHHLEQLARHMDRRSDTGRAHIDLAGVGLRIGDELRDRSGRNRRIHLHYQGRTDDSCNRRDVADEIEAELFVGRRVGEVGGTGQEDRVAVGRRSYDRLGADIAGGARPVVDQEILSHPLR
jgi:hypothetical protein